MKNLIDMQRILFYEAVKRLGPLHQVKIYNGLATKKIKNIMSNDLGIVCNEYLDLEDLTGEQIRYILGSVVSSNEKDMLRLAALWNDEELYVNTEIAGMMAGEYKRGIIEKYRGIFIPRYSFPPMT